MIILFEYVYPNSNSSSACDLRRLQITAKTLGLNTIILSPYFSETGDTTSLELDLLRFSGNINETAIFIGYIPDAVNYAALERALSSANIKLINTTEEHLRVMEFDQFYPLIEIRNREKSDKFIKEFMTKLEREERDTNKQFFNL